MITKKSLEDLIKNGTMCSVPFRTYELGADGRHRFCCKWMDHLRDNDNNILDVENSDIHSAWNSKDMFQIRQAMLNGEQVSGCYLCYQEEEHSSASLRLQESLGWLDYQPNEFVDVVQEFIDSSEVKQPQKMDLRLSSICNSMCRMCTPNVSTQLARETEKIIATDAKFADLVVEYDPKYTKEIDYGLHSEFIKDLQKNLYGVKKLFFLGGETSIIRSLPEILQFCVDENIAKDIDIQFSMNLTNSAPKAIKLLEHFNRVQINLSIDGYGALNEYIRYPGKWRVIESNLMKLLKLPESFWFVAAPTPSVYNILYWDQFMEWWKDINSVRDVYMSANHLETPEYLKINNLPEQCVPQAVQALKNSMRMNISKDDNVIHEKHMYMMREVINNPLNQQTQLRDYTLFQDNHRNMHLKDYVPELADALKL